MIAGVFILLLEIRRLLNVFLSALIVLIFCFFYEGIRTQSPHWPYAIAFVWGPVTFLCSVVQSLSATYVTKQRCREFSKTLYKAASELRAHGFWEFDEFLLPETIPVTQEEQFLAAARQMVMFAKTLIVASRNTIRDYSRIAKSIELAAQSIDQQDQVAAFKNLGELFLLILEGNVQFGQIPGWAVSEKNDYGETFDGFARNCIRLSELLYNRNFISADQLRFQIIMELQSYVKKQGEPYRLVWVALIALWISTRFRAFESRRIRRKTFVFVGPSKLLAVQIQRIVSCFRVDDFRGIAEQITDSFYRVGSDSHPYVFRKLSDYLGMVMEIDRR